MFEVVKKMFLAAVVLLVTVGLIMGPFGVALAQEEQYGRMPTEGRTAEKMVFDIAFVRIFGAAGLALGTATFVLSLPFSLLGGNTQEAYHKLMVDPARYTFNRPLGAF